MSDQPTLWDIPSAISLQESASGATRSDSRDGLTTAQSGPEVVPALPSQLRAKERGLTTLVISGRYGSISSASAALEQSLVNRLMERLDTAGSTLFQQTWKRRSTPLRRRYWVLVASERRTEDTVYSSVPTPNLGDWNNSRLPPEKCQAYSQKRIERVNACSQLVDVAQALSLASVPTPTQTDALRKPGRDYTTHNITLNHAEILSSVPSPCTPNGGRSCSTERMDATGRMQDGTKHTASLEHVVKFSNLASRSTPSSRDWKDSSGMSETGVDPDGSIRSRLDQLPRQAQLAVIGEIATGGLAGTESAGQLDPEYSRWLMGLPPEWSSCAVTAMQSYRKQPKPSSKRTSTPKGSK